MIGHFRKIVAPPGALTALLLISAQAVAEPSPKPSGNPWLASGRAFVEQRKAVTLNPRPAKNIILFIGDGMGITTVTASRIYDGQLRNELGEENLLSFERFPHLALVKTYNTNQQVPDSAGTASAMNTGVKTRAGVLGVSHESRRASCNESLGYKVPTLAEMAEVRGMATGIVSNMRVTHATPAAVYAHTPERDWERDSLVPEAARKQGCRDIARQLVEFATGDGLDVIFGGGRENFTGTALGGKRLQPRENLLDSWLNTGGNRTLLSSAAELKALDIEKTGQVMGLFSQSHMHYALEHQAANAEPDLAAMTAAAIDLLSRNKQGFYLMVEGGLIDKGHHSGTAENALAETRTFSRAIATALTKVDLAETLILVTADHSHVLTMGGYPTRGNPILGLVRENDSSGEAHGEAAVALDGRSYTTLGYQNGPGAVDGTRPSPDIKASPMRQQALIPTHYHSSDAVKETHGGEDVALYAIGPRSHLVGGVMEQHAIFHLMAAALDWSY